MHAKLVKTKKGRYVKVGKTKHYDIPDLSERELIKWIIKTFLKKKKKKKATKPKLLAVNPPTGFATQIPILVNDTRALDETRRELQHMKQLIDNKPKPTVAVFGREITGPQIEEAVHHKIKDDEKMREDMDAERERSERLKGDLSQKARENLDLLEANRDELNDKLRAYVLEDLKARNQYDKLRARLKEVGHVYPIKPTFARMIGEAMMDHPQVLVGLDDSRKAANERYGAELNRIKAEIDQLKYSFDDEPLNDDDLENVIIEQAGDGVGSRSDPSDGVSHDLSEGMSSDQINAIMEKYKPDYLGCIAANEIHLLKPKKNQRICWVMNTDPRGLPGSHWVACLIDARPHGSHSVEYYDPLADDIPRPWLADLKKIVGRIYGNHAYLRFKENRIADQSDKSNNCGEFCCHFLQARLSGETFGKASGWDAAGEEKIEKWKKKMWISSQKGEGIRDIFAKIRNTAVNVYKRIKETLSGPRVGPSPAVRGWLAKYGTVEIETIHVCKQPIFSIIDKIGNWVTQGKIRENMDKLGYDKMMHLWMSVRLKNGMTVKIEQNQIVEIKQNSSVGRENVFVNMNGSHTVQELLDEAQKRVGAENLWLYDLVNRNCQKFVLWFLGSMVTPDLHEFIEQDVEKTLEGMGLLRKVATAVTDLAATADVAMNGAGH